MKEINHKTLEFLGEYIKEKILTIGNWECYTLVSFAFLLASILFAIMIMKHQKIRKWIASNLSHCALGVFFAGLVLYIIGFTDEGTDHNPIALTMRSIIASMEMFVSESELIEVAHEMKENPYYMMAFSIIHFLAICVSTAFIIHIMGIRLRSYFKMRTTLRTQKKDLYIFFDMSQESINLAKSIYQKKNSKKDFQIVFVRTPMEESHIERFSFSHILSFADQKNEDIEELIEMNALLTYSRKSVTIGMDEKEWKDTVGLNLLRSYIQKCNGKKYFFCLSTNEDNNINTAVALSKRYSDKDRHCIYCRANRDSITDSLASINLKFIDSAYLAVMELKKNTAYHPVAFVKPDTKTGTATKPFRAMIIGFGEIGLEAFRFLYEFSSFVGKDSEENPFYCDIIDPNAKRLENSLYLECSALEEKCADGKISAHSITFHDGTIESNRKLVEKLIKEVDYIVVCTDKDTGNISTGITLLNLAYKYRCHADKLDIFVAINDNREYKKAKTIANIYNKRGRKDKDELLYEFAIVPFGAKMQLFTYKNIIDEDVLDKAKDFYFKYQKTSNLLDTNKEYGLATDKNKEWKIRHDIKKLADEKGLYYKNELTQKELQDMENAWHVKTKLCLMGIYNLSRNGEHAEASKIIHEKLFDCINIVMQNLLARMKEARDNHETFKKSHEFILDQIAIYEREHNIPAGEYKTLFENLAKCEHLRWNASNRLLGYRPFDNAQGNQKHYFQKTHACLADHSKLIADEDLRDTIKYDYNTILVSLKI